jgi:hypothetical protein
MSKRFFTKEQYDAFMEATEDFQLSTPRNLEDIRFASPKSDITILEDLYRAILRNYDLPQDKFEASSAGWKVTVEKPFKVTVEWNINNTENYGWTMNYVKK